MIKLTVHESVEAALQKAFPRPAAAAKRALAKYISVVETMLFEALQRGQTPEQRKLGLYSISLDQLANKGGQIGPKKICNDPVKTCSGHTIGETSHRYDDGRRNQSLKFKGVCKNKSLILKLQFDAKLF